MIALKPASWPKIMVPLLFGLAVGAHDVGRTRPLAIAVVASFAVADLVFIVLLNDWADLEIDTLKRRLFPHAGSQKALVDGLVSPRAMLSVALVAGGVAAAIALLGGRYVEGRWFGVAAFVCLGLFVTYSLPPVRLNYRGGGEFLEAIGIGGALPWLAAYSQTGRLWTSSMWLLGGFLFLSLASAIASGLSDEVSDRQGGKRTFATAYGNRRARLATEGALFLGALAWIAASYPAALKWWVAFPAACVIWWRLGAVRRQSGLAVTNAFGHLRTYKSHLHRAIWEGTLVLAFLLVVDSALSKIALGHE